jgi:hypothetical protein
MVRNYVIIIDPNYVRYFDRAGVLLPDPWCSVLAGDVFGEGFFRLANLVLAEASAALESSVSDDPDRVLDELTVFVTSCPLKPEPRTFGTTWHNFLIRSMLASVV